MRLALHTVWRRRRYVKRHVSIAKQHLGAVLYANAFRPRQERQEQLNKERYCHCGAAVEGRTPASGSPRHPRVQGRHRVDALQIQVPGCQQRAITFWKAL